MIDKDDEGETVIKEFTGAQSSESMLKILGF